MHGYSIHCKILVSFAVDNLVSFLNLIDWFRKLPNIFGTAY